MKHQTKLYIALAIGILIMWNVTLFGNIPDSSADDFTILGAFLSGIQVKTSTVIIYTLAGIGIGFLFMYLFGGSKRGKKLL